MLDWIERLGTGCPAKFWSILTFPVERELLLPATGALRFVLLNKRTGELRIKSLTAGNDAESVDQAALKALRTLRLGSGALTGREQSTLTSTGRLKQVALDCTLNILCLETANVKQRTLRASTTVVLDILANERNDGESDILRHSASYLLGFCPSLQGSFPVNLTEPLYHDADTLSTSFFSSSLGARRPSLNLTCTLYRFSFPLSTPHRHFFWWGASPGRSSIHRQKTVYSLSFPASSPPDHFFSSRISKG